MFPGLAMGLFSFLTGGKKKAEKAAPVKAAAPVAEKPTIIEKKAEAALSRAAAPAPVAASAHKAVVATGVAQAKLRLQMVASLRAGQAAKAYEAATGLAEIQVKAGRPTVARVWQVKAERIKASMAA